MARFRRARGVVFSGSGEGEFYVNLYARSFEEVLGYRPYPGTLNLRLLDGSRDRLVEGLRPLIVHPPQIRGYKLYEVRCYEAFIRDYPVYIVVPKVTMYKSDVVEIIARERLRDRFSLKDGDVVEVEVVFD